MKRTAMSPEMFSNEDRVRFLRLTEIITDADSCWMQSNPIFWWQGLSLSASRVAYTMAYGVLLAHEEACHTCDIRNCARPLHLFKGTAHDNKRDSIEKGRSPGLTQVQMDGIKERYGPPRGQGNRGGITIAQLAAEYNVSDKLIYRIVNGMRG